MLKQILDLLRTARRGRTDLAAALGLVEQGQLHRAQRIAAALVRVAGTRANGLYLEAAIAGRRGDHTAAIARCEAAIAANPDEPVYWLQAAELCLALNDWQRSSEYFENLLAVGEPFRRDAFILFKAAGAFDRSGHPDRAIDLLRMALAIQPGFAEAQQNLAMLLALRGATEEGRQVMAAALGSSPSAAGRLRRALMLPDMYDSAEEIDATRRRLADELDDLLAGPEFDLGEPHLTVGLTAFPLAYHGRNDTDLMRKLGRVIRRGYHSAKRACDPGGRGSRLRVGFVSSCFYYHSIGRVSLPVLASLPRSRFETFVFSVAAPADGFAQRFHHAAEHLVALPDDLHRIRATIESAQIDVLVYPDLGLHPTISFLAFSRLAPVQCVLASHPDTTGIDTMDYFVSWEEAEPGDAAQHYTERLARLPGFSLLLCDPPVPATSRPPHPAGEHNVYLCPQTVVKLHPDLDAVFLGILQRDPRALVVLFASGKPATDSKLAARITRTMGRHRHRVQVRARSDYAAYLEQLARADVVLDTLHFGGGNTTQEALALGTPVVTLPGEFLRGRFTCASYRRIGIEDCIAADLSQYCDKAVALATTPDLRAATSTRLLAARKRLFDADAAYRGLPRFFIEAFESRESAS